MSINATLLAPDQPGADAVPRLSWRCRVWPAEPSYPKIAEQLLATRPEKFPPIGEPGELHNCSTDVQNLLRGRRCSATSGGGCLRDCQLRRGAQRCPVLRVWSEVAQVESAALARMAGFWLWAGCPPDGAGTRPAGLALALRASAGPLVGGRCACRSATSAVTAQQRRLACPRADGPRGPPIVAPPPPGPARVIGLHRRSAPAWARARVASLARDCEGAHMAGACSGPWPAFSASGAIGLWRASQRAMEWASAEEASREYAWGPRPPGHSLVPLEHPLRRIRRRRRLLCPRRPKNLAAMDLARAAGGQGDCPCAQQGRLFEVVNDTSKDVPLFVVCAVLLLAYVGTALRRSMREGWRPEPHGRCRRPEHRARS